MTDIRPSPSLSTRASTGRGFAFTGNSVDFHETYFCLRYLLNDVYYPGLKRKEIAELMDRALRTNAPGDLSPVRLPVSPPRLAASVASRVRAGPWRWSVVALGHRAGGDGPILTRLPGRTRATTKVDCPRETPRPPAA